MAASPRQAQMIRSLLDERQVSDRVRDLALKVIDDHRASPTRGGPVSRTIDALMKAPRKDRPAGVQSRGLSATLKASVPCARYVLAREDLPLAVQGHLGGNDYGFYEVREYQGTRYLRQLIGAPGSYSRRKLPTYGDQAEIVRALIAVTPLAATQAYARRYSICSCCGSELTDDDSVRLGMGPVCRGRFGL